MSMNGGSSNPDWAKLKKKIGWIEPSKMSVVAILLNGEEGETIKKCSLGIT